MDVISTTASLVTETATALEDAPGSDNNTYQYFLVPFLLIQITITIFSNSILLVMIGRSFKTYTSLNVFLLSISIFNLLTIINQVPIVVFILRQQTTNFSSQLCHLMSFIKNSTTVGITLLHMFISYDRYKISKMPLTWQNNRKKAWLLGAAVWTIAIAVAVLDCILHIGNRNEGTIQTCLWPGVKKCTTLPSLYTQLLTLACLSVVSGVVYYFYVKTAKELKDNEMEKECRLRSSTLVKPGKRKLTSPERAVVSLFIIFTVHCITQLPTYIYSIILHAMALSKKGGRVNNDEYQMSVTNSTSTPVLLLLTSISFLTASSPLVLACINRKFKQHMKSIAQCMCGSEDDKDKFLNQIIAKFPVEATPHPPQQPNLQVPQLAPRDPEIFYAPCNRSRFYLKYNRSRANYVTSSHPNKQHLQVLGPSRPDRISTASSRPDRISTISASLQTGRTPRPSRISTTSASVGLAAVRAGLVLSAPGHRIMINNFFIPDANEALAEELSALNLI